MVYMEIFKRFSNCRIGTAVGRRMTYRKLNIYVSYTKKSKNNIAMVLSRGCEPKNIMQQCRNYQIVSTRKKF